MSFQQAPMFLYGNARAEMHWSASCSRALLAAANRSAEQHEQLAAALQLANQQQREGHKLGRLLEAAARGRQPDEPDEEELEADEEQDEEQHQQQQDEMELGAEQETALNLSLNPKQRTQRAESHPLNEHRLSPRLSATDASDQSKHRLSPADNDNHQQQKHQQQHYHQNANKTSFNPAGRLNVIDYGKLLAAANETHAQASPQKHQTRAHHQAHQPAAPPTTHLSAFALAGSSGSTPTSNQSASSGASLSSGSSSASSASSYSAPGHYSLSSASSSSSAGGWSAADSLASCSPERAGCLSSPPSSAASLLAGAATNQQPNQQQQQPHLAAQRPLFLHHHHHHHHHHELGPVHKADSDDLDRIRNFIEQFKARRGALGLTQKQAAQCFRAYTNDRYAFSDNFVGHFEGFQFRPQTAMTIADSLAEWLEFAENETRSGRQLSFMPGKVKETRKRKYEVIRIRDSAKRVLVEAFEKNKSPSTSELEQLSRRTNIPSRNIEIFFKNRRTSRQYHQ